MVQRHSHFTPRLVRVVVGREAQMSVGAAFPQRSFISSLPVRDKSKASPSKRCPFTASTSSHCPHTSLLHAAHTLYTTHSPYVLVTIRSLISKQARSRSSGTEYSRTHHRKSLNQTKTPHRRDIKPQCVSQPSSSFPRPLCSLLLRHTAHPLSLSQPSPTLAP
jgi:hypothetical protein